MRSVWVVWTGPGAGIRCRGPCMSFKWCRGTDPQPNLKRGAAMLPRIWRFIGTYLTAPKLSLFLCGLLAGCTVLQWCAKPTAAVPINRSEHLPLDGTKLYLLTRGADRSAPVLLWLHGGPGGAERPLFRYFNSELENHFVVVYWDQRGAGSSFDPKADPHRLTIARHVADLDAVVDHLRHSLVQDKIILIGHSWGAALSLLYARAHPDKVSAFIGVNPVISTREGQQAQYDFVLNWISASPTHEVWAQSADLNAQPSSLVYRSHPPRTECRRL